MSIRLGFSALGAPGASIDDLIAAASSLEGAPLGVELRLADGEALSPDATAERAGELRRRLVSHAVPVLAVSSYIGLADVADDEDDAAAIDRGAAELRHTARLAAAVGAPGFRVFMKDVSPTRGETSRGERIAGERILAAADTLASLDQRVLVETHDSHSSARRLTRFLDRLDPRAAERIGVIWDTAHTWSAGEPLEESLELLEARIAHLQVKDVRSREDPVPVELGSGRFPVDELAAALHGRAWTGAISLEWERAWHPELSPLSRALQALPGWAALLLAQPTVRTTDEPREG
jgi:sugar phosphate isomerase/epimerase